MRVGKGVLVFVAILGFGTATALAQSIALRCRWDNGNVADMVVDPVGLTISSIVIAPDGAQTASVVRNGDPDPRGIGCVQVVQVTSAVIIDAFRCPPGAYYTSYGGGSINRFTGKLTTFGGGVPESATCAKTELRPKF